MNLANAKGERPPRIGINTDISGSPRQRATIPLDYIDAITHAGGLPIPLAPVEASLELLPELDGIVFIGGDDYQLGNHAGVPRDFSAVDPRRERIDFALAHRALECDLPTLGICCGFQLIVLAQGGRIHGDVPSETQSDILHKGVTPVDPAVSPLVHHDIHWHTPWQGLSPCRHRVNSHHHQAVSILPQEWSPLATADDGIVEAAAGPGTFQLGLQWHPEKEPQDPLNAHLMGSFIKAASR